MTKSQPTRTAVSGAGAEQATGPGADPRRQQILHWICTGQHVIRTDDTKPRLPSVIAPSDLLEHQSSPDQHDQHDAVASSTTSSTLPDKLVGVQDDPIIPHQHHIDRLFSQGREAWKRLVASAESLPPQAFPAGFGEPSITLKDVPALPDSLPRKRALVGRPLWRIPDPEHGGEDGACDKSFDLQYAYGVKKHLQLSFREPIQCRLASGPPGSDLPSWSGQRGLPLLTLSWSYILSVRLLELQGRRAVYSQYSLIPEIPKSFHPQAGHVAINLGPSANPKLVRWLCAILSPKPGWSAEGGGFPPWAAFCHGEASFTVLASTIDSPPAHRDEPAPNSAQATELLIELCALYGFLAPAAGVSKRNAGISPPTAAFMAALALPFYRDEDLQPRFEVTALRRRSRDSATFAPAIRSIRRYAADLRYYMTLSMDPRSLGPVIWSIFWQPDVECNLVSPWLGSISSVLKPLLESHNWIILAKVFALRRPRIASWWLGIFLLGDNAIFDRVTRYLETLEERWGFGSMASPDITAAAWTGAPQSFLDEVSPNPYRDLKTPVSRADLLRHRYNFRLQDTARTLSWRPFGHIPRELVEPDIWPWLERGFVREYVHWVWYLPRGKHTHREIQLGFRQDTGRFVPDVPDRLDLIDGPDVRRSHGHEIKLEPSKQSTLNMLHYSVEDLNGDRDWAILGMPGVETHP